jgi:hypothetical protein
MTTLCSWPVRTVMFRPICAYCGKEESFYAHCEFRLAVLACDNPEHRILAKRDANSWLHKNGRVRREDYTKDPLFQETELLTTDVHVIRSSGEVEAEGWMIRASRYDDHANIKLCEGAWYVPVIKKEQFQKSIQVQELKLSLPEDKHALVDAFEAKLTEGFYLAESLAYDEAKRLQEEQDNPAPSSTKTVPEDNIQPLFHPIYGIGRVFMPSRQEEAEGQGDPAQGDPAQGDQAQGDQAQGNQAQGNQAQGDQTQGDQTEI